MKSSAVKRLIAINRIQIKVCVYICVCIRANIFCIHSYTHIQHIFMKYLHAYTYVLVLSND